MAAPQIEEHTFTTSPWDEDPAGGVAVSVMISAGVATGVFLAWLKLFGPEYSTSVNANAVTSTVTSGPVGVWAPALVAAALMAALTTLALVRYEVGATRRHLLPRLVPATALCAAVIVCVFGWATTAMLNDPPPARDAVAAWGAETGQRVLTLDDGTFVLAYDTSCELTVTRTGATAVVSNSCE